MNSHDKLKARIESRRWAEECYAAADDKAAFAQRVDELHNGEPVLEEKRRLPPMSDFEARVFEKTPMPFGAHLGKALDAIPLIYLQRLVDPPSQSMRDFLDKIRRYLASPAIMRQSELIPYYENEESTAKGR